MSLDSIAIPAGHRLVRISEEPRHWAAVQDMGSQSYQPFMDHDPVANEHWGRLRSDWPAWQLVLVDPDDGAAAVAQSAPLYWDGTDEGLPEGWDDQVERSTADLLAGRPTNTIGAIQICVAPERRGQGLSGLMLEAMREIGREAGFGALIACVRPTDKESYPLMPIDIYAAWRRPDGLPFDPWLRVHARAGARIVRASPESMTIKGSVADWEEWTGLRFPVSGSYVVKGALNPIEIDLSTGRGVYHDPNVWMVHPLNRPLAPTTAG